MKVATVKLARLENTSAIITSTYTENVRGFERISYEPQHVVFHFPKGFEIEMLAYRASEVLEIFVENEEE